MKNAPALIPAHVRLGRARAEVHRKAAEQPDLLYVMPAWLFALVVVLVAGIGFAAITMVGKIAALAS